jgi:hypothetical protein
MRKHRLLIAVVAFCTVVAVAQETQSPDHFKDFLNLVEQGKFDKATIYTDTNSSIGRGLLNTPVSHWKSFTQKQVLKDDNIKRTPDEVGRPLRILEIETKTGHKITVHLVDQGAIKKMREHSQAQAHTPSLADKL